MNSIIIILLASIVFQVSAALYALSLIRLTGKTLSWLLISAALLLMSVRRAIPLFNLIVGGEYKIDYANEVIGLLLSILMLLGVSGIKSIFMELENAKKNATRHLAESETLLKEVHHRIKNNIITIESMLSLQTQSPESIEALPALRDALGRIESMRILYEKLLLTDEYSELSVKEYIEGLVDSVAALCESDVEISINKQISDFMLGPKQMFPLGIIVNELLTNVMKYAFRGKQGGLIVITLGKEKSRVTLTVQDDGVGIPEGFDPKESSGLGLMLINLLAKQLGGSYSIENHEGTRSILIFNA